MKLIDLIKTLSQYDLDFDVIFCDSSCGSLDYEDYETDRDLMIGKYVTICCGFYDRDIDCVIQVDYTDSRVNYLELSIQDFQLDH